MRVVLGSRSNRTGQGSRKAGRAGRRETTKDTSGARECGWWMDGDLVCLGLGWEIGSLETTRWRRDRSVPNVMLRACDWCEGSLGLRYSARVCSNGHVTVVIVFSGACLRVWHCADGCQQTSMALLPSRPCPFTRVAEQRRVETTSKLHALLRRLAPGECRARPAPPAATLAPTRRRRGTAATCTHVDVPCRAGLAVYAAGFTCRRAARPAIAPWWCGINCLDVQLSRAGELPTTRETDRVGLGETLPAEYLSTLRDWTPLCHSCVRCPRSRQDASPSPSWSVHVRICAASSSRARSSAPCRCRLHL